MLVDSVIEATLTAVANAQEQLDATTWRAVVTGESGSFRLFVRRAGDWLRLELSPFIAVPSQPELAAQLFQELLQRNRTLMEARFSLADDGDVILEAVIDADSPAAALASALDAIVAAAQTHYVALRSRFGAK